jgi:hypothetical protein
MQAPPSLRREHWEKTETISIRARVDNTIESSWEVAEIGGDSYHIPHPQAFPNATDALRAVQINSLYRNTLGKVDGRIDAIFLGLPGRRAICRS